MIQWERQSIIMSRSVKTVYWCHRTPGIINCSFILRIATLALIIQLSDSLLPRNYDPSKYFFHPNGVPWSSQSFGPLDVGSVSDIYKKSSNTKYRKGDVEVSYNVEVQRTWKKGSESEEEIIKNAIDKIFPIPGKPPGQSPTKANHPKVGVRILGDGRDPAMFRPQIPENCESDLICFTNTNYPREAVEDLVKDLEDLRILTTSEDTAIGNRNLFDKDTENLCQTTETISPLEGVRKSQMDDWHMVVNVPTFKQIITVSHCSAPDAPCNKAFQMVQAGRSAICKQQYSHRRLLVISPTNGTAFSSLFSIPSGCCCHLKSPGYSNRFLSNTRQSWSDNKRRRRGN